MIKLLSSTRKLLLQILNMQRAYSNVGLVYLMKAQDYADKATTDINDPKYAEAQATVKKFYEEAKPFYEKSQSFET